MQVHCGAFDLLGEAGVDNGFIRGLTFCLFAESGNLSEYDDGAFLGVFVEGD